MTIEIFVAADPGTIVAFDNTIGYQRRSAWKRVYVWDFSLANEFDLIPAETGFSSATANVIGPDNALTAGPLTISGKTVKLLLSSGTPGATYLVTVTATTSPSSFVLDWPCTFTITG